MDSMGSVGLFRHTYQGINDEDPGRLFVAERGQLPAPAVPAPEARRSSHITQIFTGFLSREDNLSMVADIRKVVPASAPEEVRLPPLASHGQVEDAVADGDGGGGGGPLVRPGRGL